MAKKQETATDHDSALDTITRSVADRLRGEIVAGHERIEGILFAAAREGRKLSFDETVELRRLRPDWDERKIQQELRRVGHVHKHQQVSGTVQDRATLDEAAEQAAQVLADEGARLRAEIEQRQAALRELEKSSDSLRKRQADVAASLQALTQLLPDHIEADLKARRRASSSSFAAEHNRITSELRHRDRLRQGPGSNPLDWSDHLRRAGARVPVGQICSDAEAARLFAEWDVERDSMDRRVAELAEHIAAVDAEEAAARRHYFR